MFKFEGKQTLYIAENGHEVTVIARTEFFNGKQPRYCVQSETAIPGKNVAEDWINEDKLTDVAPVAPVVEGEVLPPTSIPTVKNKKGIRTHGIGGA